jgi:hypothetical protein
MEAPKFYLEVPVATAGPEAVDVVSKLLWVVAVEEVAAGFYM